MWFWIWCALVVAALVGAFFLGRALWRKVRTLTRSLDDLGRARDDASARSRTRIAAATSSSTRGPDVFRERAEMLDVVAARRAVRRARSAERRAGHAARYAAWRDLDR